MKPHFQAIKIILCSLALGASVSAQTTLNPPNDQMETVTNDGSSFTMGTTDFSISDAPVHQVAVDTFQMDQNLIAYGNWQLVYQWATNNGYSFSANATAFSDNSNPVQSMSWYDAVKWCNARSQMESTPSAPIQPCYYTDTASSGWSSVYCKGNVNLSTNNVKWDANGYRLPTEAEWEKAARGGLASNNIFPWGMTISQGQACYNTAPNHPAFDLGPPTMPTSTRPVGLGQANGYNLYDMAGNVEEWCWDVYSSTYYRNSPASNPWGPASGSTRVARGGEWDLFATLCRCASRQSYSAASGANYIGFRTVRVNTTQVTVKETPTQSAAGTTTPSLITYGQTLTNLILMPGTFTCAAGTNVDGIWTFANSNSTPAGGSQTPVPVIFTPYDTTDFNPVTTNVNVEVDPATPILTPPNAIIIKPNTPLTDSLLTGGAAINPNNSALVVSNNSYWSFSPNQTLSWPAPVSTSVAVTWTPQGQDTNNYTSATANVSVQVIAKAGPTTNIFLKGKPTATAINYGQALSSSVVTAIFTNTAGLPVVVAGTFTNASFVPSAGSYTGGAIFTSTDPDYIPTPGTNIVTVTVTKATPQLALAATEIIYGQSLTNSGWTNSSAINTNNAGNVAGHFTFSPTTPPNAGTIPVTVTFTPRDTTNYNSIPVATNVVVGKATPALSVVVATGIKYGQTLSNSFLSASKATNANNGASVPGTFSFTPPLPTPGAGTTNVSVTFTPTGTGANNYTMTTTTANVVVGQATPVLSALGTNIISVGANLADYTVKGGKAVNPYNPATTVSGLFEFTTNWVPTKVSTNKVSVTFTPTGADASNYTPATNTAWVIVKTGAVPLIITANDATWDMSSNYPTFTVRCSGLLPGDFHGDTNNLVGTNTVFGTNLYVWSPAAYNSLPIGTYTNFIIPVLVGTNNNYSVTYEWGNLTIINSSATAAAAGTKALAVNNVVVPASLTDFLGGYTVDQAGLNAVLAHYWSQSPPNIANTAFPGRTNLCFTLTNFMFTVQYSTDLSSWNNLDSPARILFTDTNAVSVPNCYYRLVGSTNYSN